MILGEITHARVFDSRVARVWVALVHDAGPESSGGGIRCQRRNSVGVTIRSA